MRSDFRPRCGGTASSAMKFTCLQETKHLCQPSYLIWFFLETDKSTSVPSCIKVPIRFSVEHIRCFISCKQVNYIIFRHTFVSASARSCRWRLQQRQTVVWWSWRLSRWVGWRFPDGRRSEPRGGRCTRSQLWDLCRFPWEKSGRANPENFFQSSGWPRSRLN